MIISGDLEIKACDIGCLKEEDFTGNLTEMKELYGQRVTAVVDNILANPEVTDATAFLISRDNANKICVERVELMRSVTTSHAVNVVSSDYTLSEENGFRLYRNFCELTEIMFNDENISPTHHGFCVGDINNNYFIEKEY